MIKDKDYKIHYKYLDKLGELAGVYLLRNLDNNELKIGSTENLNNRIKDIEKSFRFCGINPRLKAECFIEYNNNLDLERFLHKYLKQYNYMNEWFNIDDINIVLNEIQLFKATNKIDFDIRAKYKIIYKNMIKQSEKENSFICDEWKEYINFERWIYDNLYYCNEPLRVSKDIINENSNEYSPDTCILIPRDYTIIIQGKYNIKQNTKGLYSFEHKITNWNNTDHQYNIFNSGFIYKTKEEAIKNCDLSKLRFLNEVNEVYEGTIPTEIYKAVYNRCSQSS